MSDFTWSYSSLKQYQNCPKQYYEIKVAENYTVIPSEQMKYGTDRKSTRLNSSHTDISRMPSSA